jgi:hypothetical protein
MNRKSSFIAATLFANTTMAALSATSYARPDDNHQICTLGSSAVGQPGAVVCKNVLSGTTTQSVAVGALVAAPGGIAGSLARHGKRVLVTNQAQGAVLFEEVDGWLKSPVTLQTGGEGSLSGVLSDQGAYVLTGTRILFFRSGQVTATSSQPLLEADGSAAQVTLAGGNAYVSEKSGSLEAFALRADGNVFGEATPIAGVPAGVIVGITGFEDVVVAPVAHLASNASQSTIPVVRGLNVIQIVPTKEVAACWASNDDGEACVTNPGSMTVSCGRLGLDGFMSYTGAAASLSGDTVFDIDVRDRLVGILGMNDGAPLLLVYGRTKKSGDFLNLITEFSLGAATATGALLLPPLE